MQILLKLVLHNQKNHRRKVVMFLLHGRLCCELVVFGFLGFKRRNNMSLGSKINIYGSILSENM